MKKERRVAALAKDPDENRFYLDFPLNELEAFQILVGGHIECVTIHKEMLPAELEATGDLIIVCNEEGRLQDLDFNCTLFGYQFVGPVVLVGQNGDEFDDFPFDRAKWDEYFEKIQGGKK